MRQQAFTVRSINVFVNRHPGGAYSVSENPGVGSRCVRPLAQQFGFLKTDFFPGVSHARKQRKPRARQIENNRGGMQIQLGRALGDETI